ncbi:MAG: phosphatase PAP2 family protein [Candidatus Promineofilum sp.]|nr:phosphatase PAP2 family protein [Promineifilum sp.]
MEELYQLSIALATLMQEAYPRLLGVMSLITALGTAEFFLVFLPAIYWCVDKRLGRQLGYIYLLSAFTNNILKNLLRQPRPYWLDPDIQRYEVEGFGLPSGHVQNTTAVFLLLAATLRRTWVWIAAILFIVLMGLSRLYLGVHSLQDIVVGFAVGLIILIALLVWQQFYFARFNKQILGRRLLLMVLIPTILAAVYVGIYLLLGPASEDVSWAAFVPAAELSGHEAVVSAFGALLGFGVGIMLESSRVRFHADGPVWKRILRFVLGIGGTVGIWAGLRTIFPSQPLWLGMPLHFLRYLLTLLWVTYFAPWVFVRLRLASADAESEVRVTL